MVCKLISDSSAFIPTAFVKETIKPHGVIAIKDDHIETLYFSNVIGQLKAYLYLTKHGYQVRVFRD